MIISQDGVFEHGTAGFPVEVWLEPFEAGKLTDVTSIVMNLERPDGTEIAPRTLPVPACIIDTQGKIEWFVLTGDIPIEDIYTLRLAITFAGGAVLNVSGDFDVS